MKRIPIYIISICLTFFAPVKRVDVGMLQPVEIIYVGDKNGQMLVRTDTGDCGIGDSFSEALKNMHETSPFVIYLDTADYLLIRENTKLEPDEVAKHLKTSIRVCLVNEIEDLQMAGKYLKTHGDCPKLKEWKTGEKLTGLTSENKYQNNEIIS